jgi:phosphate transport system substrate-binding protein
MSHKFLMTRLMPASMPIATLIAGFAAQQAQAVPPVITGNTNPANVTLENPTGIVAPGNSYIDCDQDPICSNGAGSTFPFPLFAGGVPDSTPLGAFRTLFPDQFNYAAIGSGGGITSFLRQLPPSSIIDPATGLPLSENTVPGPLSFASTDAPLTQAQLDTFYAAGANLNNLGYGVPVEIPLTSGAVTVSFNDGIVPAVAGTPIQLTRVQECTLFNGGVVSIGSLNYGTPLPLPTIPPGSTAEQIASINAADAASVPRGVRRSDNSGTTFIMSNHLNEVCGNPAKGINLWSYTNSIGQTVGRGFGQVSLPDNSAACQAAAPLPASVAYPDPNPIRNVAPLPNTVCWPSTFTSGSGNPGVAAGVNGRVRGSFGYVEFATAASNVDGSVDTGLTAAARSFPNLDISAVENSSSVFVAPTSNNVILALSEQADQSAATCRLVINAPDPSTLGSYPIVGVNYGLFYSDYFTDITRSGANSPRVGAFVQGLALRDRYRLLVQRLNLTTQGRALQTQFGYAPLPNTAPAGTTPLANRAVQTAVTCINNVVGANGIAGQDVAPQIAP